ncbi:MATE family efflux transporter [Peribacillus frigoritolerans]|uniref:MATE family efflux transporter n=1 Tax=Peribacillus frigoritolerans TaxID=450367 RepID=UPI002040F3B6|nr:MATE family efflux transporter [Peribacillus frigoritolerans]MCM3168491.1 MATE family efflux transporter [Peribacillus frigoritolerans]
MNHRSYLALAIPLTISTITTPLIGAVDTAVVGQLPNPAYLGGVAIGTVIFNTLYWLFGFLRVSTSGFAAQALGANDGKQGVLAFLRPFILAIVVGGGFILLQGPIEQVSLTLMNPDADVRRYAAEYFSIRIWGIPFTLMNYVILGWLMGMSKIKVSLVLQVFMNLMNIALDFLFVHGFQWGVPGVAIATLLSEVTAFFIGLIIIVKASPHRMEMPPFDEMFDPSSIKKMMSVNRDLFIRTLCLLAVFNIFTAKGASYGTEILAANAVLIQIHYMMAYFFDGLANASSILVGKAIGARDKHLYKKTLILSLQWGVLSSILLAVSYYLCGNAILALFTRIPSVIELANIYGIWLILFPLTASVGIVFYGVFTGATEAAPIRNSMIYSLIAFMITLYIFVPAYQNHALWLAFTVFSLGRSVFLALYIPRLSEKIFPNRSVRLENDQMV